MKQVPFIAICQLFAAIVHLNVRSLRQRWRTPQYIVDAISTHPASSQDRTPSPRKEKSSCSSRRSRTHVSRLAAQIPHAAARITTF